MNLISHIKTFLQDEEGASAIEYALVAALIAVAAAGAMGGVGDQLIVFFDKVKTELAKVK